MVVLCLKLCNTEFSSVEIRSGTLKKFKISLFPETKQLQYNTVVDCIVISLILKFIVTYIKIIKLLQNNHMIIIKCN